MVNLLVFFILSRKSVSGPDSMGFVRGGVGQVHMQLMPFSAIFAMLAAQGGRLRGSSDANYPCPPPPPLGAFGQQLVAKGVALRRPWAPKAPDAP